MTTAAPTDVDPTDARRFAQLVEQHRAGVVAHCRRMLRTPERAEDAAQEALLRAWRARRSFAGRSSFATWLRRIATNVCLDEIHRSGSVRVGPLTDGVEPPAPAEQVPEAVVDAGRALAEAVHAILGVLPPRQRAVLVLRGVLGLTATGTAAALGTSTASVNSALQRARATLRAPEPPDGVSGEASEASDASDDSVVSRYAALLACDDVAGVIALARTDVVAGERAQAG